MATTMTKQRNDLDVTTISPKDITGILLSDGWHAIENVEFTQFAVSPSASPPQPNKLYSGLRYNVRSNQKQVVTPLSKVLGFETK